MMRRAKGGAAVLYRFTETPELADLNLDVRAVGRSSFVQGVRACAATLRTGDPRLLRVAQHPAAGARTRRPLHLLAVPAPVASTAPAHQLENFLRNRLFGRRTPMAATLAVTAACQLRCRHCSAALRPHGAGATRHGGLAAGHRRVRRARHLRRHVHRRRASAARRPRPAHRPRTSRPRRRRVLLQRARC